MFEISTLLSFLSETYAYLMTAVTIPSNWIQVGFIALSLLIGWFVRRKISDKLKNIIGRSGLNFRIRQILTNLIKLIMPVVAVLILGVLIQIQGTENFSWTTNLAQASMKLIMAWIVIRFASQIIENTFARQTVALIAWVIAALSIVGLLDGTVSTLNGVGFSVGESKITLLAVTKAILLIFTLLYAAIFVAKIIERRLTTATSLTPSSRVLISKVLRVTLITTGLLVGITSAGVDLSLLAVFGGAIGLGIGFGLQKGVSNLFSGILLLLDKSINPGDIIELQNGVFGWIHQMGARYTSVVTRDNKSFLIPNEDFITQQVINWSHGDDPLVRIEVNFGVHYDSDPHQIRKLAVQVARAQDRVSESVDPVCHLTEFGDSSLNFTLRFWITDAQEGLTNIKGLVLLGLWDVFKAHDIQIPYPHREVYIHEPNNATPSK